MSNWYQIWVGQGYTAAGDFAPLRHLWSLAVEEQFYLLWPLVMIGLIRLGRRRLPSMSVWLVAAAIAITAVAAVVLRRSDRELRGDTACLLGVGGRCISKMDFLYLSTPTRLTGLLLGSAFAMVWRPVAIARSPLRSKGRLLESSALVGLVGLGALCWWLHIVTADGADPWLFKGGFLVIDLATLLVIAAVTHRRSLAGPLLGSSVLLLIGIRSYGLYLYHWPIYQAMRGVTGRPLSVAQFVAALAITAVVTEVSFRIIETPIRRGTFGRWWRRLQAARDPAPRRVIAGVGACLVAVSVFAVTSLATAELKPNEIAQSLEEAAEANTAIEELLDPEADGRGGREPTAASSPGVLARRPCRRG